MISGVKSNDTPGRPPPGDGARTEASAVP